MTATPFPMFPLMGTVLFPSMVLPLRIFEPRYRELMSVVMNGDREFGVVLIDRGLEVGGDDSRNDLGTVASILEAEETDDGQWALVAVGTRRIAVDEWLPDDPYPQALVRELPDPVTTISPQVETTYADVAAKTRRALAMHAELGAAGADLTIEFSEDPALGSFQLGAVGPLGLLDRQTVLGTVGVEERISALTRLIDEELEVLEQRMELG